MTCLPPSSKCEWRDLKHFVQHLNSAEGKGFARTNCLDLCSSSKQPEVLCTDADGSTLVIERKSVVWPESYAAHHQGEHRLFSLVSDAISPLLGQEAPYELRIYPLASTTRSALCQYVNEIKAVILENRDLLEGGTTLKSKSARAFCLRKQSDLEREDGEPPNGLCIITTDEPIAITDSSGDVDIGFSECLSRLLASAPAKFKNYGESRRIVLLQPISSTLYLAMNEQASTVLSQTSVPECVNEIWLGFEYADKLWTFTRVFPGNS